jgi:hypothetical protein
MRLVAAACAAALASAAGPADAAPPRPVTIALHGHLTGPTTVQGTWESSGAFSDSGTYTEVARFVGPSSAPRTIHVEQRMDGARGTFVIRADALVISLAPMVQFAHGSWRMSSGTGAYEEVHAGGTPAVTPQSFGDLASGVVEVQHVGQAH